MNRHFVNRRHFLHTIIVCAGVGLAAPACSPAPGSGAFQAWGEPGRRKGKFRRPRAVAFHRNEVYVIDTTGRLQIFDEQGTYLRGWNIPDPDNGTPTALAFDASGLVLVPDTHNSRILEYTPEGELRSEWGEYGTAPGQFIYPTGIVRDADGISYISEYGVDAERVQVFDADRKLMRHWGGFGDQPGKFNRAMDIARDETGMFYVADTGNHRIQCFDAEGNLQRVIGGLGAEPGQIKFPYGVEIAPDGSLIVCEYGNHRISIFDTGGAFIEAYGTAGRALGEFNGPRGVAISPSGRLYVADTDNHRIQWTRIDGMAA